MNPEKYVFVVDQMLGRLAKWLRLMGYDALYFNNISDRKLIQVARAERRILLTRDTRMMKRREIKNRKVEALLVNHDSLDQQLEQVGRELQLSEGPTPYCSLCNVPVQPIEKAAVREKVPPYVFRTQEHFARCPSCGRIYWRGTHWEHIRQELHKIFRSGAE